MSIDEERCVLCIWHNDDTFKCEGNLANHGFLSMSPYYKSHPELKPEFAARCGGDNDCIGMELRPEVRL